MRRVQFCLGTEDQPPRGTKHELGRQESAAGRSSPYCQKSNSARHTDHVPVEPTLPSQPPSSISCYKQRQRHHRSSWSIRACCTFRSPSLHRPLDSYQQQLRCKAMETVVEDIVIAGAGLAGLATALGLHRKGVRSLVLESSPKLRASGFAFTTWTNAFRALDALGVGDKIREHHLLYERLVTFSASTGEAAAKVSLKMQGKSGPHEIRCVKRNFLLETLENELPEGTIRYSSKIVAIDEDGNVKVLHLADGTIIRAKVLVGCDGVNSVVAKWLGLPKPILSGRSATRGLAEYPAGHGFGPEILQFIGQGFRSGVLPCSDTSVYWNYTWYPSPSDGDAEESVAKMRSHVLGKLRAAKQIPAEALDAIERSEMSDVVSSPLRFRSPLSLVRGSISRRGVCVAGDALHPMTPELGQGGCAALEDGVVLARCLGDALAGGGKDKEGIDAALERYAEARRWRGIQLITAAYVVGFVQQSNNAVIRFLREKFLSGVLAKVLVAMTDYDCGKL